MVKGFDNRKHPVVSYTGKAGKTFKAFVRTLQQMLVSDLSYAGEAGKHEMLFLF